MYTAVARRCTRSVHAVNSRVHGHIHGTYTAVHTGRKHGRLHGRVHGHGRTMYMARVRGRLCTDCARPPSAVYKLCTRAVNTAVCTAVNTAVYTVTDGPCTWPVHGRAHSLYTVVGGRVQTVHGRPRPCTNCVHGRTRATHMIRPCPEHGLVRSRYVAKHGRVRGPYPTVYVPYTWPCTGRVHGTRPSTRPSLRPVCTAVYVLCTRPCMVRS